MMSGKTRCGFVCVLGLPNAGKSTLVNALVGEKVSIVSRKTQTTRSRVLGIVMKDNAQVILVDTPGIFAPRRAFDRAMVEAAWAALEGADSVIHIVDALDKNAGQTNRDIIERLPENKPCFLVLNKTDKAEKAPLLTLAKTLNEKFSYAATFMISALRGDGVADILSAVENHIPEGPFLFDPEQTTDMPLRLMAAEITREKIFDQLHEELPYAVFVETEGWENFDDGSIKINQIIYVQKETQRAIVLGKKGSRIRDIGTAARKDIEALTGTRAHLKLFVKIRADWPERAECLRLIGL